MPAEDRCGLANLTEVYKQLNFSKYNKNVLDSLFSMLMLGKGTSWAQMTCQTVYQGTHRPFLCALLC